MGKVFSKRRPRVFRKATWLDDPNNSSLASSLVTQEKSAEQRAIDNDLCAKLNEATRDMLTLEQKIVIHFLSEHGDGQEFLKAVNAEIGFSREQTMATKDLAIQILRNGCKPHKSPSALIL